MRFTDRVCLVTGATGGIGRAIAGRLAGEGATVALHTATRPKEADRLAGDLDGSDHTVHRADLTDADARDGLVDDVLEIHEGIDVLVNNAGVYTEHPVRDTELATWREVWDRTLELNLRAPADLSYRVGRRMADRGGGSIVNVSSRGAFRGEPDAPAYGASKAGLNALTQSLAQALGDAGVVVAAVAPGFVETPMVDDLLEGPGGDAIRGQSPMDRVATPEEVAACVAFLASGEAEFVTGAILDVNGASYLRS